MFVVVLYHFLPPPPPPPPPQTHTHTPSPPPPPTLHYFCIMNEGIYGCHVPSTRRYCIGLFHCMAHRDYVIEKVDIYVEYKHDKYLHIKLFQLVCSIMCLIATGTHKSDWRADVTLRVLWFYYVRDLGRFVVFEVWPKSDVTPPYSCLIWGLNLS